MNRFTLTGVSDGLLRNASQIVVRRSSVPALSDNAAGRTVVRSPNTRFADEQALSPKIRPVEMMMNVRLRPMRAPKGLKNT